MECEVRIIWITLAVLRNTEVFKKLLSITDVKTKQN